MHNLKYESVIEIVNLDEKLIYHIIIAVFVGNDILKSQFILFECSDGRLTHSLFVTLGVSVCKIMGGLLIEVQENTITRFSSISFNSIIVIIKLKLLIECKMTSV